MTQQKKKKASAIRIKSDRDGRRPVLLQPANNDVFVRTGRQVIEACQLSISVEVWLEELKSMLAHVKAWCEERADRISFCVAVARGSKLILFFMPAGKAFDFDLADEMTELNREVVTSFNLGVVEVGQIPAAEAERFFDPAEARPVYGRFPEAPRAVAT